MRSRRLTRREFLEAGAATALVSGAWLAGCAAPAGARAAPSAFAHGVASGDPLADRVVLWTRVTPPPGRAAGSIEVTWRVARDPALRELVASGAVATDASRDFTCKVDVQGLEPGCTWYYGFELRGQRSAVGRTRTLPDGRLDRLRLAFCCCANYAHGFYTAYAAVARRADLDAVVHTGDYIYEYGNQGYGTPAFGRVSEPDHELVSLADYRARYAFYRRDPDLQELHRQHPMIAVWDDHEVADDAWRDGAQNHDPATQGPFPARREAAVRAWREWMPARVPDGADFDTDPRIWRSFRFGDLADLVLLDTRLAARDAPAPRTDRLLIEAPGRTLLGAAQEQWLFATLDASRDAGTAWRLLGQQVVFAPMARPPRPPNTDAWDGYPEARGRLLDHLASAAIRDVVILSGDIQSSWAFEVERDPFARRNASLREPLAVEFVAPAVSSSPLASFAGVRERFADASQELPHLRFMELESRGYLLLDVDAERAQAEWWYVDGVDQRGRGEHFGAAFATRRGANRLEPVSQPSAPRAGADQNWK